MFLITKLGNNGQKNTTADYVTVTTTVIATF